MDPMLDMANCVAGLPWAMHQSLEGEGFLEALERAGGYVGEGLKADAARRRSLRSAIRAALLVDLPVTNEHRFEGIVSRVAAAVEALEERP